jgi:flagellar biogenesis protein FliO
MIHAILIGLMLSCTTFYPAISTVYAEEVVVEKENFLQEENPPSFFDEENPSQHQVIDVRKLFFKTLIMLAGLCGLVVAGGYFLKRISGGKLSSFSTDGAIQLIERKYLSPKTSLWLVEVKNQPLVIIDSQYGVAIHSLKEIPEEKNLDTETINP